MYRQTLPGLKWLRKTGTTVLRHDWLLALVVALVTIAFGFFLAKENNGVIPVSTNPIAHYTAEPGNSLSFMANWDAPDYLDLVKNGYQGSNEANFFPLYPLAIRALHTVVNSPLDSALLLGWAGFVGALYFYLRIIKQLFAVKDNREALRGALLFILYPTAVFLMAPYTEGVFAFFALGALYFALQKRLWLAAGLTALATATHVTGVFLLPLLGLVLLEQGLPFVKAAIGVVVGSLGLASYMVFLQIRFHNALAFITAQQQHGWLQHNTSIVSELSFINMFILFLLALSTVYWYCRRRYSFVLYSLLFFIIPFAGGQMGGFNRYTLMAFPVPLMLYSLTRKNQLAFALVLAVFSVLWTHFVFQYAGGYIGG